MSKAVVVRISKSLIRQLAVFVLLLTATANLFAQYQGKPVTQERLEMVLRTKQLSSGQIVETVRRNGVNFQLTAEAENRLVAAGARPQVLEAIRQNFRNDAAANSSPGSNSTAQTSKTISGAPLSKDAVLALLQNGVADAQVQKNIKSRGVSFQMNPETAREIKAAGGSDALVGMIFASYSGPASPEPGRESGSTKGAVKSASEVYDELMDRALDNFRTVTALDALGTRNAIQLLQQALTLDPNNPRAHQSLGYIKLYGLSASNFGEVEGHFSKAISLGGNAVVRVFHDHNGIFSDVCEGSLYISKDMVRFESDNNVHTFETGKDNIQQVKTNNPFKQMMQEKQGSYKIVLKSDDKDGVKYSFAPLTGSLLESKMVVRLVGKNN